MYIKKIKWNNTKLNYLQFATKTCENPLFQVHIRKRSKFVCNEDVLVLITLSSFKISLLLKLENELIQNISWHAHCNLKLKTLFHHERLEPIISESMNNRKWKRIIKYFPKCIWRSVVSNLDLACRRKSFIQRKPKE